MPGKRRPDRKGGRKPVQYAPDELARKPQVIYVCGADAQAVAELTRQEIALYLTDHPETQRKGRKVLVFDTRELFPEYRTVSPFHLGGMTNILARRIRAVNADNSPMTKDERQGIVEHIRTKFKNGLVLLQNPDLYMNGANGKTILGQLLGTLNAGLDKLLTFNSLKAIPTDIWAYCTDIRLHNVIEDVRALKQRLPRYPSVRIAQFVIQEQIELATKAFERHQIDKAEYERRKGFFLYISLETGKVRGCSMEAFIRAVKRYLDHEESRTITLMMKEETNLGTLRYANRNQVIVKLVKEYLQYWEGGTQHHWS